MQVRICGGQELYVLWSCPYLLRCVRLARDACSQIELQRYNKNPIYANIWGKILFFFTFCKKKLKKEAGDEFEIVLVGGIEGIEVAAIDIEHSDDGAIMKDRHDNLTIRSRRTGYVSGE